MFRMTAQRQAVYSLTVGIAMSLVGVAAVSRSYYPWVRGYRYPLLAYVAAPAPILLDGLLAPTLWLLNVVLWATVAWLCLVVSRPIAAVLKGIRAYWSSLSFSRGHRISAAGSLVGLILVLQYVAISNSSLFGSPEVSWRGRSLIPVVRAPWWNILQVVRPVLTQPTAAGVRFVQRHRDQFRGTAVARWLDSSAGGFEIDRFHWILLPHPLAAERLWDWGVAAMNTAAWFVIAVGLWRVTRIRLPASQ
jgi:hypothetical protein